MAAWAVHVLPDSPRAVRLPQSCVLWSNETGTTREIQKIGDPFPLRNPQKMSSGFKYLLFWKHSGFAPM